MEPTIERLEDMSSDGRLILLREPNGDVSVILHTDMGHAEVEFCEPGSGGGLSPHTLTALYSLMEAMERDNQGIPFPGPEQDKLQARVAELEGELKVARAKHADLQVVWAKQKELARAASRVLDGFWHQ